MHLFTNIKMVRVIRAVVLVMLFQTISPTVFALTSDPKQSGYTTTICTIYGYKQAWVSLDTVEKNREESISGTLNCPYCLLNLSLLDDINATPDTNFIFPENRSFGYISLQSEPQQKTRLKSLPIRAPPTAV